MGEVIGLSGNILEKIDDILMDNGSSESIIRAGVSLGVQYLFMELGDKGVEAARKVSEGVGNKTSEFLIGIMAGEGGKIYDKAIQEKLKNKENER